MTVEVPAEQINDPFMPRGADGQWVVLHVRPRCEKKVASLCEDKEIQHYLPLRKSTPKPKKGQRRYSFDVPLFPGYIFACLDRKQRHHLLVSGQLVRAIEIVNQKEFIGELRQIYMAINSAADLVFYPQLKRGKLVRVLRGPLKGVTGMISKRKENFRLVLNLSILGQAVAAEMSMDDVELY
jgi:transcription antitermination factor NusG